MSRWMRAAAVILLSASTASAQHTMRELVSNTEIHFFADVNAEKFAGFGEKPATFRMGNLDFYVFSHLGQFTALTEFAFEPTLLDYTLDVERLQITWTPAAFFQVTAGRYHTPLGFWNVTYHHGRWMFTTVDSPLLFRFEDEGGPLPAHTIGLLVFGFVNLSSNVTLRYDLGVGNGRGKTPDPPQKISDINEGKSVLVGLHLQSGGFRVGAAAYIDSTEPESLNAEPDAPTRTMHEQIAVGDITYTTAPWELLLEGALIRHTYTGFFSNGLGSPGDHVVNNYAGYAQVAYQVVEHVKPYARGEIQRIQRLEPFLQPNSPDQNRALAGIRFDPVEMAAIKLEGGAAWRSSNTIGSFGRIQIAFVF